MQTMKLHPTFRHILNNNVAGEGLTHDVYKTKSAELVSVPEY